MDAKDQRNIMIVLMALIIGILLFPEVFRKAVLEVATEQTGREHDGNQSRAPSPQKDTIPFTRASSVTA